jgi:hypothetical protein
VQRRLSCLFALVLACGRAGYDPLAGEEDAGGSRIGDAGHEGSDASVFTAADAGADTFLASTDRGFNFGGLGVLRTAAAPAATVLLRFDLGEIAAGAVARGAALTVWTTDAAQEPTEVRIYRVFEEWVEGDESGESGAASWDDRIAGQEWTSAGCGVGSRDAAARADLQIDAPATRYQVALPASVVQGWIDQPGSNFGLALIARSGSGVELVSSQSGDPERRPSLAVEWAAP